MSFRTFCALSACSAALSVSNLAVAQQVQVQPRPAQPLRQVQPGQAQPGQPGQVQVGQAGQQSQWMNADQTLANCLAIANQEEVAIAKIGEEKAKNKDVKEFAKMLVSDHKSFLQKLQRLAPEATQDGYLNEHRPTTANGQQTTSNERRESSTQARVQQAGAQQPATNQPREVRAPNGAIQQTAATNEQQNVNPGSNQPINFVQLHREIAEQCIHNARQEMDKKNGADFDECFVGHQLAAHEAMKTKLTVFQRHASGELNQLIADGIQTTEKHRKRAEELMHQLKDSDSSSAKRDRNSDK